MNEQHNLAAIEIGDELYKVSHHEITKLIATKKIRTENFTVDRNQNFNFGEILDNIELWAIDARNKKLETVPREMRYGYADLEYHDNLIAIKEEEFGVSVFHARNQAVKKIQDKIQSEITDLVKKSRCIKAEAKTR